MRLHRMRAPRPARSRLRLARASQVACVCPGSRVEKVNPSRILAVVALPPVSPDRRLHMLRDSAYAAEIGRRSHTHHASGDAAFTHAHRPYTYSHAALPTPPSSGIGPVATRAARIRSAPLPQKPLIRDGCSQNSLLVCGLSLNHWPRRRLHRRRRHRRRQQASLPLPPAPLLVVAAARPHLCGSSRGASCGPV